MSNDLKQSIAEVLDVFYRTGDRALEDRRMGREVDLTEFPRTYRGICYESYSMHLAFYELGSNGLDRWTQFEERSPEWFLPFVWIGAGWAYAKHGVESIPAHFQDKFPFIDGMGFYMGMFQGRTAVKLKDIPTFLTDPERECFDIGLGRSLWYSQRADISKVSELIGLFPVVRQGRIWEGIGVASHYVRGLGAEAGRELLKLAGIHAESFLAGTKTGNYYVALESKLEEG